MTVSSRSYIHLVERSHFFCKDECGLTSIDENQALTPLFALRHASDRRAKAHRYSLKFAVGIAEGANAVQPAKSASMHAAWMDICAMASFICDNGDRVKSSNSGASAADSCVSR
jgi:hypothetical protein